MKPEWKNAPEWANYLAMDYDRRWYWYETLPRNFCSSWSCDGKFERAIGKRDTSAVSVNNSLEKRP